MGNEHVDRVLELCDQALQRPADVAYPTENGTDVDEWCWRCTAAAAETELGLCGSCDGELRREERPVEAGQHLGMSSGVRSDLLAAFWEGFNQALTERGRWTRHRIASWAPLRRQDWGYCGEIFPVEVGGVQRQEEQDETVRGGGADGVRRADVGRGPPG